MIKYDAGDLVIMTHPLFDSHILAEVVSTTKATCRVLYISVRGKSDEPKQRKLSAISGRARTDLSPSEIAEYLAGVDKMRAEAIKEAEAKYRHAVGQAKEKPSGA